MNVLIEGFGPDAIALARFLAEEGNRVRLAGRDPEPSDAAVLRGRGIVVEPRTDLDDTPGPADVAYLDPWTPETAPRVVRLRAEGTRVSCLGNLLLERWRSTSIGITGTAGKTTTTALTAAMLRAAGIEVAVSHGARAGNLWPTGDLIDRLSDPPSRTVLLLELTSSHLAFMDVSPTIAAVTSFWPDHLELHGSLARYRTAKETIVRHQTAGDHVVVNADDEAVEFAALTPATRFELSLLRPVENGAYVDSDEKLTIVQDGHETVVCPLPRDEAHPANVVAAAAIAVATGADAAAIDQGIRTASTPGWRATAAGTLAGVLVIDDGMAATPSKAAALLRSHPDRSVVLIAGGLNHAGGGLVHAAPEERPLLENACDEIARAASSVVVFGEAAPRLVFLLERRDVETITVADLDEAVAAAARQATRTRALTIAFSPLFPVSLEDRARFQALVASHG